MNHYCPFCSNAVAWLERIPEDRGNGTIKVLVRGLCLNKTHEPVQLTWAEPVYVESVEWRGEVDQNSRPIYVPKS